jgi:hypothetical protein
VLYFKVRSRHSREETEENYDKFVKITGDLVLITFNGFTRILQKNVAQVECLINKTCQSVCQKKKKERFEGEKIGTK